MLESIKSFLSPLFGRSARDLSQVQSLIRSEAAPLPIQWASDEYIWEAATQKPIEDGTNGTSFLRVMKQFYECLEEYNEAHPDKKVLLFVTQEVDHLLKNVLPRKQESIVPIRNLDGFAFYTGGKYYTAYYLDNFEDVGFRVYRPEEKNSYAYFRIVEPKLDQFAAFIRQVVYRDDPNPKLHF